jgi:hypothetical protein
VRVREWREDELAFSKFGEEVEARETRARVGHVYWIMRRTEYERSTSGE